MAKLLSFHGSLFFLSLLLTTTIHASPDGLMRTPPMGWMSWQTFRCTINCTLAPTACIDENLYRAQADALVATGFAAAGYTGVHLDDCIVDNSGRDKVTNQLKADPIRFPSGFAALGEYIHSKGLTFSFYTAESTETCGGYPASAGNEVLDSETFASWGVDYVKADGCGPADYYPTGYATMGAALQAQNRSMIFSCSWPAYLGNDESTKPFAAMIAAGCNLWRNYLDMGPVGGYVQGILEHWGNYSEVLSLWSGPGHIHDPDQLIVGYDSLSDELAQTQFALYCILAAPLILGTDMRKMKPSHVEILLNADAISVNQDPAGKMGVRLGGSATSNASAQIYYRPLANGDVAVGLYNYGPTSPTAHPFHTACAADYMNITTGGYYQPAGIQPQSWCFAPGAFSQSLLDWYCCNSDDCAGYNYSTSTGAGCLFKDTQGGFVAGTSDITGYAKKGFVTPTGPAQDITLDFSSVGLFPGAPIQVYDIWQHKVVAITNATNFTATVPWQGTAFYRLSTPGPAA